MAHDVYAPVNAIWPTTLPAITREEARRAAKRLMRHFAKRDTAWLRRCWIALDPARASGLDRGWRRLVHDVSHRVYSLHRARGTGKLPRIHGGFHANLERDMAAYVLAQGWLDGRLKPAPTAKRILTPNDKLAKIQAAIRRWESKRKRAETALKKLRAKERRALRVVA